MRAPIAWLALLLLGSLAACRSAGPRAARSLPLEVAATALDLGDTDDVERQLEPLFADDASTDGATRFRAAWLLAQARALRALEEPATGAAARERRTRLQVGALYFAGLARAEAGWVPPAGQAGTPGPDEVRGGLELLRATLHDELGFAERSAWLLDQLPGLEDRPSAARLLERSGMHPRLGPRVWLALFRDRARRDPAEAFPLAVEALASSDRERGALEPAEVRAVEDWIEEGAPYRFRCPDCGQPAVPQLRACPNDQTPLGRFVPSPRP